MRTAELEVIQYDKDKIYDVSKSFVYACRSLLNRESEYWRVVLGSIGGILYGDLKDQVVWKVPGVRICFKVFPPVLPIIEGKNLVYKADSPHFILEEGKVAELPILEISRIRNAQHTIVDTMQQEYQLEIDGEIPFIILRFPKERYAVYNQRFQVPII